MVDKQGLTDEEWEMLLYVPFAVFFVVAWADGKVAPAESNLFGFIAKSVATAPSRPQDALARDILAEVSVEFGQIARRMDAKLGAGLTLDQVFESGRKLLDTKLDKIQAQVFKNTMVVLAERVAGAAPLFGSKVSDEEHKAIGIVKQRLGVGGSADPFVPFSS